MSRFLKELAVPLGIKDTPVYAGNKYDYGARYDGDFYGRRQDYGNGQAYSQRYGSDGYGRGRDDYARERREDRGYSRSLYSSDDDFADSSSNISGSSGYASPASSFSFGGVGSGAFGSAKKPAGGAPQGKYKVGTKVRHAKFGNGTVVAIRNGGSVINVAFEGQGIKELSASLAPLTIIG